MLQRIRRRDSPFLLLTPPYCQADTYHLEGDAIRGNSGNAVEKATDFLVRHTGYTRQTIQAKD